MMIIPDKSDSPPSRSASAGQASPASPPDFSGELLGIDPRRFLRVTDDLCIRIQECKNAMGLMGPGERTHRVYGYVWNRICFREEYAGHFAHRAYLYPGSFFDPVAHPGGNLSLGIAGRFVKLRYAKHSDNLVGTDPFVAVMPAKVTDQKREKLSKQVEAKVQDEVSRSNLRFVLDESIRVALVENDRVIKLAWVTEKTQRPELRAVAVYLPPARNSAEAALGEGEQENAPDAIPGVDEAPAQGAGAASPPSSSQEDVGEAAHAPSDTAATSAPGSPIKTPKGDFIFEKDDFISTLADAATGKVLGLYQPDATDDQGNVIPGTPVPPNAVIQLRLRKAPDFIVGTGIPQGGKDEGGRMKDEEATGNTALDEAPPAPNQSSAQPPDSSSFILHPSSLPSILWTGGMLDPATGKPQFATIPDLIGTDTLKDQLEAYGLKCEDFIWDVQQPTLDHSDVQVHVYDEDLDTVYANYGVSSDDLERRMQAAATDGDPSIAQKYKEIALNIRETTPQSALSQGIRHAGEVPGAKPSTVRKTVAIWESYYRVRLQPNDKFKTWIFVVIDAERKVPIFAEYLGNMRMKRPPFRILRGLESEPSRAYGVGIYQIFETRNLAIDYWHNRAKLKTTKDASADFMHPDAFQNEQDAQQFTLGSTKIYRLKSDTAAGEQWSEQNSPIFRKNLHEDNAKEWDEIEKLTQTGVFEFGLADIGELNAADAGIAKDATATATRNVERSGNTLQRSTDNLMAGDFTEIMEMATDIILENADLGQGEFTEQGDLLPGLNRDEIRDLPRDVRMLMTKARSAESLETQAQVEGIIDRYYQKPKWLQKHTRSSMIESLKALDVQDADDKLKEPTDQEIAAEASAAANPPKQQEQIQLTADDMLPSEIGQLLQQNGIQPDPARTSMPATTTNQVEAASKAAQAAAKVAPAAGATPPKRPGEGGPTDAATAAQGAPQGAGPARAAAPAIPGLEHAAPAANPIPGASHQ